MDAAQAYDDYWKSGRHVTGCWPPDFFKKHLGSVLGSDKLLDYGCGLGYSYQRPLSQSVKDYWGADVSDFALEDLKNKSLKALKIQADGSLDIPDSFFDSAVCSEVFEHLFDPLAAAREINRVLKPGGIFVATVPHFGYFPWRLRAFLQARVWDEPDDPANPFRGVHIRYFSIRHFQRLLQFAGFSSVEVYPFDSCNIWHLGHALGPFGAPFRWADKHLPKWTRFGFLDRLVPSIFAQRIRAVAIK